MNRSRQEFSSRSKSFNSSANKRNRNQQRCRKQKSNSKKTNSPYGTRKYAQKDETTLESRDLKEVQNSSEKQQSLKEHANQRKSARINPSNNIRYSTNYRATGNVKSSNRKLPKPGNQLLENVRSASTISKQASEPTMDQRQIKNENILESVDIEIPNQQQIFANIPPETGQKRKNQTDGLDGLKQSKKIKRELSASGSDALNFIDLETSGCSSSSFVTVSDRDLSRDENSSTMVSLNVLWGCYDNNRDYGVNISNGACVKRKRLKEAASICKKTIPPAGGGWIEEENDVKLEYDDSDSEPVPDLGEALVPHFDGLGETLEYDDYALKDLEEEEGISSDENDTISFEIESTSDEEDDEPKTDSDTEEGDSDSEMIDSDTEVSESDTEVDEYDTEDEDVFFLSESLYKKNNVPPEDDDLFIGRGEAIIYEIDDNNVSFNSDIDMAHIAQQTSGSLGLSSTTSYTESLMEDNERRGCPKSYTIHDATNGEIDCSKEMMREKESSEKLLQKLLNSEKETQTENIPLSNTTTATPAEGMAYDTGETHIPAWELCELSLSQSASNRIEVAYETEVDNADIPESSGYQFYDAINKRMSLLVLKEPIHFSGHLTIQPLIGSVEVMGYHFKRNECRNAYAVCGYHCLNLSPLPERGAFSTGTMEEVLSRLKKHFFHSDLEEIINTYNPVNSVLILLEANFSNNKISVAERFLPQETLFPKPENLKEGPIFTTEYLLNAEFFTEHRDNQTALFRCNPEWENMGIEKNSRVVVMGGKGAGKSTLCQYLINKNVRKFKKVVLIDLDIDQPIQHIPETISVTLITKPLLGVATFEPIAPMKAWLFGSPDVVSSPIFYIQNIRQLILYCQQNNNELANIPWIVNTIGYVAGFGEELMAAVLQILNPTDVVQLVAADRLLGITNFQNTLNSNFINQYNFTFFRSKVQEFSQCKVSFRHHQLNVCFSKKGFMLNASKRRNLMLLAHLANILDDSSAEWFRRVRPFCVPLSNLQVLITREDQNLNEDQLRSMLNAMVVYLGRKRKNATYECLGIGIVRGIDKNNNVHLLQSLPGGILAEVTVLAICSSSFLNAVFLQKSARTQGSIPYVSNVE